jgi:hypothetical protein
MGSPTIAQRLAGEPKQSQELAMGEDGTFSEDKGICVSGVMIGRSKARFEYCI